MQIKTKDVVNIGIYVALTLVLDFIKEMIPFLNLPMGGSINIALIPVVIASLHLGVGKGLIVSAFWLVLGTLFGWNGNYLNAMQWSFDYLLPTLVMGFAGIFYKKRTMIGAIAGTTFTMILRTLFIIISGAYFWFPEGEVAGSTVAWIGSFQYNLPYSIATLVVLLVVVPIIVSRFKRVRA